MVTPGLRPYLGSVDVSLIQRVNELRARHARGEREQLEVELRALPESLPAALARRVADLWAALDRWARAAEVLEPHAGCDLATETRLVFARNMAALADARPALYADLLAAAPEGRPRYITGARGQILVRTKNGLQPLVDDPIARAKKQWDSALEMASSFGTIGLVGVGDGCLLAACSAADFELPNGMTQPILLIEPDLELLRVVMSLHDFSQPHGLIHDPRGLWCVGPDWRSEAHRLLVKDASVFLPKSFLVTWASDELQRAVLGLVDDYVAANNEIGERNHARDARRRPEELLELLGDAPPRSPRVLLITSDFTRVLKHATRNLADTFTALGWTPTILSEGAGWRRLPRLKIRRTLSAADPDVVVIINHARPEYGSVYPPNLPFVTWVQDQMPNLERAEIGAALGSRDFVMTGMKALEQRFGYPSRQVVRMRCLTRAPRPRPAAIAPPHDLVYVSHSSYDLDHLQRQLVYRQDKLGIDAHRGQAAFDAVVEHYRGGNSLPTSQAVCDLLAQAIGLDPDDVGACADYVGLVSHPNIVLYRQQGLAWAVSIAEAEQLDLAIYGEGWAQRSEFAAHARGPVAYGDALEALQRRARFNLVLEPFPVTSHWRGLDCMVAGAMPLVRRHPYHDYVRAMAHWLDVRGVSGLDGLDDVRAAAVTDEERAHLDELVRGFEYLGVMGDPVAFIRSLRAAGATDLGVPPGIEAVSFDSRAELAERVGTLLDDEVARRRLTEPMRAFVSAHLSYESGLRWLVNHMRTCIASEPALDDDLDATAGAATGFASGPKPTMRAASSS